MLHRLRKLFTKDPLNIRDLPWSTYTHAYGPASDVPDQVLALLSSDKKQRVKALGDLFFNIYHQGSIYQATQHAVPFLLRIAANPQAQDRHEVLSLLSSIARGGSWHDAHQHLSMLKDKAQTAEYQAKLNKELDHVAATRAAVIAGLPTFTQLLADPDPNVRDAAAYAIASLGAEATSAIPALTARAESEPDDEACASAIYALSALKIPAESIKHFRDAGLRGPAITLALNLADIVAGQDNAPSAAIDAAFAALANPPQLKRSTSLWYEGNIQAIIIGRLYALPPSILEPRIPQLIDLLAGEAKFTSTRLIQLLTLLLFPPPKRTSWDPASLTPLQRRFIIATFDSGRVFKVFQGHKTIFVNAAEMLDPCGLPSNYEKFEALADQCRKFGPAQNPTNSPP